jgi:hypothetical protein
MQTSNGQSITRNKAPGNKTGNAQNVSKVKVLLTPAQAEFIDLVIFHGVSELSASLKRIHDLALYHTDVLIDTDEKSALFDLKILWEGFERIEEEV